MKKYILLVFTCLLFSAETFAQDIKLPAPKTTGGMPLMEALSNRQTARPRVFTGEIDKQTLSNLLWAANGFNRENNRTAPTAHDRQELEIYVVLASGSYWWDSRNNVLVQKVKEDIRALTGQQPFVATAPVNIIVVADTEKQPAQEFQFISAGYVSQNMYLFCASEGLSTVVRANIDRAALSQAMKLPANQVIIIGQTIGQK